MTRAERLQAYVEAVEGKPVEWGIDECTSWVACWISGELGTNLPRLSFSSRREANQIIERFGGLENAWSHTLEGYAVETPFPGLGDVGVVSTSRFGHVGVIFAENGFALWRAEHGTALLTPRKSTIVRAWAI